MKSNKGNRWIHHVSVNRYEWLNYIPTVIRTLSGDYHFYWSNMCHNIRDLHVLLKTKKDNYKSRMALYYDQYTYYFVIYCKHKIDVYELTERYCNTPSKYRYFLGKWRTYYICSEESE